MQIVLVVGTIVDQTERKTASMKISEKKLTPKQQSYVDYITMYVEMNEVGPTQKMLCEHFRNDPSTVYKMIQNLIEKGLIQQVGRGQGSFVEPTVSVNGHYERASLSTDQEQGDFNLLRAEFTRKLNELVEEYSSQIVEQVMQSVHEVLRGMSGEEDDRG